MGSRSFVKTFILKLGFEKAYDRVRWYCIEEVLHKKGFDPRLTSWMMQLVQGGQTSINISGKNDRSLGMRGGATG